MFSTTTELLLSIENFDAIVPNQQQIIISKDITHTLVHLVHSALGPLLLAKKIVQGFHCQFSDTIAVEALGKVEVREARVFLVECLGRDE